MRKPRVSRSVLDSSAVLASFYGEAGADIVDDIIRESIISTVNAAEVISKLVGRGMTAAMAKSVLIDTGIEIAPFDLDQAEITGDLRGKTRAQGLSLGDRACLATSVIGSLFASQGLSLGDRACLALAKRIDGRAWAAIEDIGVEIVLLRR
jgi:PIN domain nuclease of toxin-antitoxin system